MCLCAIASLLAYPTQGKTVDTTYFIKEHIYREIDYINHFSDIYNAPQNELLTVAKCESGFNQGAVGDSGTSFGIFQYKKDTWNRYNKLTGQNLDINSAHDQAKLTALIFSKYPREKVAWTCYSKNYL